MATSIHGVPAPKGDGGKGKKPHQHPGVVEGEEVKEEEAPACPIKNIQDRYTPSNEGLACDLVNYGKDPKLKAMICAVKKPTPKKPDAPPDMEFEPIK